VSRGRTKGRVKRSALLAGLVAAALPTWAAMGGMRWWGPTLSHLALFSLLAVLAMQPPERLQGLRNARRVIAATFLLALAGLLGWLPVPPMLASVLAPGTHAMVGGASWTTLGVEPTWALLDLTRWVLVLGFVVGLAVLLGRASSRRLSKWAVWATMFHALVALAHPALGLHKVLGFMPPRSTPETLLGPLVNPNHAASLAAAGAVICAHRVMTARRNEQKGIAILAGFLATIVIAMAASTGAALALLVGLFVLASWRWIGTPTRIGAMVAATTVLYGAYMVVGTPGMREDRAAIYAGVLECLPDFWLVGSGPRTFEAIYPFCSGDREYHLVSHAHADGLQWIMEHGVAGTLLGGLAAVLVVGGLRNTSRPWAAAAAALLTHAMVDFPLQIPIILVALAVLATAATHHTASLHRPGVVTRIALLALAVAHLASAMAVSVHAAAEQGAESLLEESTSNTPWVSSITPWRWEWSLHEARTAEDGEDTRAALVERKGHDADALRHIGTEQLLRDGADAARPTLSRAATLRPNDLRLWILLAELERREGDVVATADAWGRALCLEGWHSRWKLMLRAYRTVPEGLVWVDRLADCDPVILQMLGRRIGDDDPEVSLLAFQLAARDGGFSGEVTRLLVSTGRAADALAYVQSARGSRPHDTRLKGHEGRVWVALEQADAAIPMLVEASNDHPAFRADLVRAHALRDPAAAREVLHRFRLMGDTSPELGLAEAEIELQVGRLRACEAVIRESGALRYAKTAQRAVELRDACAR